MLIFVDHIISLVIFFMSLIFLIIGAIVVVTLMVVIFFPIVLAMVFYDACVFLVEKMRNFLAHK